MDLLANPEALWNVLVVNGPSQMGFDSSQDPTEFLTPVAQFVRGICSVVILQRLHIETIFEELRRKLAESDVSSTESILLLWKAS